MLAHDICSAIQNAFRARHKYVALPHTNQSLGILTVLLQNGFIMSLSRGTPHTPSPSAFLTAPEFERRIWAELKYRDERPVLNAMHAVSKPSRRIFLDQTELMLLCTGRSVKHVRPLGMGEIAVVRTQLKDNEWMEARQAVQLRVKGGELMCRAG
ncbi:ribosomal protein S8 [Auricularia subglabra TFB-10046 SS5]|uniref:Ribosomal protein S8 n=1 Tax=Auricularia subglabra (strain TFB-10046 / SS5) TaxID=717982 RepID=J0LFP8_AURST|nr:ribosomal protein S8 [Auricularia subglabra TFB-10046 SS5]